MILASTVFEILAA